MHDPPLPPMARICEHVLPKARDAKRREKVRDLRRYMLNNAGSVVFPKESMDTLPVGFSRKT